MNAADGITGLSATRGIRAKSADKWLGYAAIMMIAIVLAAVARGHAHWSQPPASVWVHLGLMLSVLVLTPIMMIRPKGAPSHRALGYVWAALMIAIALESFLIPIGHRSGSPIWLLSIFVLVTVPLAVRKARRHDVAGHRGTMRGLVIGAFLVAGFFTLPFGRMLGSWLLHG